MRTLILVPLTLFAMTFAANGEDRSPPPPAGASTQPVESDPVVCRKLDPPIGSRIGARKVCQRQSLWERLRIDSERAVNKLQRQGTLAGHGG